MLTIPWETVMHFTGKIGADAVIGQADVGTTDSFRKKGHLYRPLLAAVWSSMYGTGLIGRVGCLLGAQRQLILRLERKESPPNSVRAK